MISGLYMFIPFFRRRNVSNTKNRRKKSSRTEHKLTKMSDKRASVLRSKRWKHQQLGNECLVNRVATINFLLAKDIISDRARKIQEVKFEKVTREVKLICSRTKGSSIKNTQIFTIIASNFVQEQLIVATIFV